jgi:hypothetical protein
MIEDDGALQPPVLGSNRLLGALFSASRGTDGNGIDMQCPSKWLELLRFSQRYPKIGYSSLRMSVTVSVRALAAKYSAEDCEALELGRNLQMEHSAKAFWEKAKPAGEFIAGIAAIIAGLYGLSWVADDIFAHASSRINLRCAEIVFFTGVLSTPRSLAEVQFEMPRRLKSIKQCAALIVWSLDQHAHHRVFRPARHVGWIEEGRENRRLLPWVMSMAEYNARPQCVVQRDWLRLALRTLGEYLAPLSDDAGIVFRFDGSVLSIRLNEKVIALPGEGSPWAVCFRVEARTLRQLPKRLMRKEINVSIWESHITLGNYRYAGTLEEFGTTDPSRVH